MSEGLNFVDDDARPTIGQIIEIRTVQPRQHERTHRKTDENTNQNSIISHCKTTR